MIKKLLATCVIFLFLFGCSTTSQLCMKPEAADSLICPTLAKVNLTPESANVMFKLANVELLRSHAYAKEDVLKFFDSVESVLSIDTYQQLAEYIIFEITGLNTKYGAELMILSQSVDLFKKIDIPISEFDKDMLREHIKQQRQILVFVN